MGWIEGACALGLFIGPLFSGALIQYVSLSTTLFVLLLVVGALIVLQLGYYLSKLFNKG